ARVAKRVLLLLASWSGRSADDSDDDDSDEAPSPFPSAALDLTAALLRHARDEIQAEGREFHIVEVPRIVSRTEYQSTIRLLPAEGIDGLSIISPVATFNAIGRPELKLYYERGQGHLTPTAV